jgi:hypothetical protein
MSSFVLTARSNERPSKYGIGASRVNGVQRCEPLACEIGVRRELIVGQRLPIRQAMHRELWCEPSDLVFQSLGVRRGCSDHDKRLIGFSLQLSRDEEGIGTADERR